jgi:hypothetical protein
MRWHHNGGCRGARHLKDGDDEEEIAPCSIRLDGGGGRGGAGALMMWQRIPNDPGGGETLAWMGQGVVEP